MTTLELLNQLKKRKIALWEQDGRLQYRAPAGALDESLKAEIRNHKPVLLRLLNRSSSRKLAHAIPLASREKPVPASFPQKRLWLLDQIDKASNPAFNEPHIFKLEGLLEESVLRKSLEAILQRHEALRTSIRGDGNELFQVIQQSVHLDLPVLDLTHCPQDDHLDKIQKITAELSGQPFDFGKAPMMRIQLVRTSPAQHWLIFIIHHIAFDGWSRSLFKNELSEFYTAFKNRSEPNLPELKIQYADYAAWQNSRDFGSQVSYWREHLQGAEFNLDLSFASTDETKQSHMGGCVEFSVPAELGRSLKQFGQKTGTTLFMVLLATYELLLYRYTGQSDFIIGTPIANRTRPEIEPLIGFFLNTLILKGRISGTETFRDLVGRVRQTSLSAFDNQDVPIEKVLWDLHPNHDPRFLSPIQVTFQLQNVPRTELKLPELTLTSVPVRHIQSQVAMNLVMTEDTGEDSIQGSLIYQKSRFPEAMMTQMAGHFQGLLGAAMRNPDTCVAKLPYISEDEKSKLRKLAIQDAATTASPEDIVSRFEGLAERIPEKGAIESTGQRLTYRELNKRANQLAHWLRKAGVGRDSIVGICMERSPETIISIFGILKAGGACLPMDPAHPRGRLLDMLEDSQARVLLAKTDLNHQFSEFNGRVFCLDREQVDLNQQRDSNPEPTNTEDALAYVIYTSGSTGRPKGVMIDHRSLQSFMSVMSGYYGVSESDRILQFASLGFDTSCEEILITLTQGATLVLRTDGMIASTEAFWRHCEAAKLTVLDLPTAFWHQLASDLGDSPTSWPKSLRLLVIGGEAARPDAVNTWLEHAPSSIRLLNTYGPTESTIVATAYEISGKIPGKSVPIGHPIPGIKAFILDQHQQLVPIGIPGELCLGGTGLARGYLNREDLTTEKFVAFSGLDESGKSTPERIYRTGDRVRYNENGEIEFLGRMDNQVKIRGYRVELGEIEAVLRSHSDVKNCVVVSAAEPTGDIRLAAYFVPEERAGTSATTPALLREYLKTRLPDYMMPLVFMEIPSIPVTMNGKVDTEALPSAEPGHDENLDTEKPQGATEEMVAQVWMDVFNVQEISRSADFFELGGHSILAMRIINALQKETGVRVSVAALFDYPVLHEFAQTLEST